MVPWRSMSRHRSLPSSSRHCFTMLADDDLWNKIITPLELCGPLLVKIAPPHSWAHILALVSVACVSCNKYTSACKLRRWSKIIRLLAGLFNPLVLRLTSFIFAIAKSPTYAGMYSGECTHLDPKVERIGTSIRKFGTRKLYQDWERECVNTTVDCAVV